MKKRVTALLLAAVMAVSGVFDMTGGMTVKAAETEECTVSVIDNAEELDSLSAMYTMPVSDLKSGDDKVKAYGSFKLTAESWVYLYSGVSLVDGNDGHQTHVSVYSDASMSNMVAEFGDGYWEYTNSATTILKKGTYYFYLWTSCENYQVFSGNVNLFCAAIQTKNLVKATVKLNKAKTKATVSFADKLGKYMRGVQWQKGSIGKAQNGNNAYWQKYSSGSWYGYNLEKGRNPKLLTEKNGKYSFSVKKNGKYTVLLQDTNGNFYSKVITVKGIKTSKKK